MRESGYDVLLAVPTRGSVRCETVTQLEAIRDSVDGMRPILYQQGNVSVAVTRNAIVKRFLETDAEVLVMIDDDVAPPQSLLTDLLPLTDGFGCVGIPYTLVRNGEYTLSVLQDVDEEVARRVWPRYGLTDVDVIGTGCVAIAREVFERFDGPPFRLGYTSDGEMIGEDLLFCRDLRAMGWRVGCMWTGTTFAEHIREVQLSRPLLQIVSRGDSGTSASALTPSGWVLPG